MPSVVLIKCTLLLDRRNAIQVIYLLCKNVKKVDRSRPNDQCKERNNSVLHLKETKSVILRETYVITPNTFKKRKKIDETSQMKVDT